MDVQFEIRHLQIGHAGMDLGPAWIRQAVFTFPVAMGVPALALALVGVMSSVREHRILGLLIWSFPLAYYVVAGSGRVAFARYMTPMVPFICIAAALGVCSGPCSHSTRACAANGGDRRGVCRYDPGARVRRDAQSDTREARYESHRRRMARATLDR